MDTLTAGAMLHVPAGKAIKGRDGQGVGKVAVVDIHGEHSSAAGQFRQDKAHAVITLRRARPLKVRPFASVVLACAGLLACQCTIGHFRLPPVPFLVPPA